MKKLTSPLFAAILGLVLGLGTGLFTFWRASEVMLAHAIKLVPHKDKLGNENRERGWNFWTIEIENLANELKGEREQLRKRADELGHREAQLAAERKELEKIRSEVERIRDEIAAKVIEINIDEVKNIRQLATTYAALTPRAAVAIIREMDDVMAVKILSVMKPEIVSPIFEEMSRTMTPEGSLARRAAIISDRIRLLKATKTATNP
jgi:flagellar motility protein MotE (MotC chaperone)